MSNRRKLRKPIPRSFLARPPGEVATYWNGQRTPARQVRVVVADHGTFPSYWARDLVGQEVEAVRVEYAGQVFHLDNRDGSGWRKVTEGHGGPGWPSRTLEVYREVAR